MAKDKVLKSVTYYSPHRKQTITVSVRDEKGNLKPKLDRYGNQVLGRNAEPLYLSRSVAFQTLIDSPKVGYQCILTVDFKKDESGKMVPVDSDLYAALEALADDPSNKIVREDDYKRQINPDAFKFEQEMRQYKAESESLKEALSQKDAEHSDAIAKMQKEMADLKAMLDDQTKPQGVKKEK